MSGAGSDVVLRVDPAGRRGPLQGGEVGLRLVGIRCGEVRDGLVEDVPATRYAAMAIRSPDRACARASVWAQISAYVLRPDAEIPSVSSDPFQSWSWRT